MNVDPGFRCYIDVHLVREFPGAAFSDGVSQHFEGNTDSSNVLQNDDFPGSVHGLVEDDRQSCLQFHVVH
jgi:hypothetical protein